MSEDDNHPRALFSVVLGDANVLYSRVLRDYLLYAMSHQLLRLVWSAEILEETVEHLVENLDGFDRASGERLAAAMNGTFPYSQVEPTDDAAAAVAGLELPDEDDRHVIATAVAAEAAFLCSDDLRGFPPDAMAALGIEAITSDALLSKLIEEAGDSMLEVHRTVVARLPGASDESTLTALRAAKAVRTAELMKELLGRK